MISYEKFTLNNGLQVLVHEDHSTPMAVLNVLYNVGSRDESADKTGFAHLFEHLMFGGSINIASYDDALQKVGGENNAFTSPDITNYYLTLPANNLETAFWLESDRMLSLAFDKKSLEVQRKVVIEEFNQRYLNQPYGDVWLKLRPLAYHVHPYAWATIGKEVSHIENATMEDVKAFFAKFYIPNNAVMVVAGNVSLEQVKSLSEKWFAPIPAGKPYVRNLPVEPKQTAPRRLEVTAQVPANAIYKTWHSNAKLDPDHVASDLLSDLLGHGKASRLYVKLVKENPLFSSIGAHVSGSAEAGLFIIEGKLHEGISFEMAENAINEVLVQLLTEGVTEQELNKVKNQAESTLVFSEVELLNRAMNLAFAANLGDVGLVNQDLEKLRAVDVAQINRVAREILIDSNCSTLIYRAEQ